MKKNLPIFVVLFLLALSLPNGLTLVGPVAAQTTPASTGAAKFSATDPTASSPSRLKQDTLLKNRINNEAAMKMRLDKIASKTATLRAKLQTFRDQKKAATVERINSFLASINTTRTTEMTHQLDKMSAILAKVEARVAGVGTTKDTASASAAITSAKTAIETARTAVTTQSENDYTITVTSETAAKSQVKAMRDKLLKDLKATHTLVVKARQAVANAISTTSVVIGGQK